MLIAGILVFIIGILTGAVGGVVLYRLYFEQRSPDWFTYGTWRDRYDDRGRGVERMPAYEVKKEHGS